MTDEGEGRTEGDSERKRKSPKRKRKPGKKARKEEMARRRARLSPGRRRIPTFAVAHPVRRDVLRLYIEKGESFSPTQVAKLLDRPLGIIMYHVAVLHRVGILEPVEEKTHAAERPYSSTVKDNPSIALLPDEDTEADDEDGANEQGK
jgi:Helix-turn-helix domain